MTEDDDLPPDWQQRDSIGSFDVAVAEMKRRHDAGEPLPIGGYFGPAESLVLKPVTFRGQAMPGYWISPTGQVWSDKTSKILRASLCGPGREYLAVALRCDGRTIRATVHQLVAEAFIGPRPREMDVCHNDGVPTNNDAENLRYASRAENLADRERHGTAQRGERNPAAKLTNRQAEEIRIRRRAGEGLKSLSQHFGVAESAVSRIANGVRRPW